MGRSIRKPSYVLHKSRTKLERSSRKKKEARRRIPSTVIPISAVLLSLAIYAVVIITFDPITYQHTSNEHGAREDVFAMMDELRVTSSPINDDEHEEESHPPKSTTTTNGDNALSNDENDSDHNNNSNNNEESAELAEWKANVCGSIKDHVCWELHVVGNKNVTFCSAAKVASTTTSQYFVDISDGLFDIPKNAKYGVHEADWERFGEMDGYARDIIINSPQWTHVFFWKHVLERFVSGYLDKVVHDCENYESIEPHLAISHYIQYGFSCKKHKDLRKFVGFMETVPQFEGHFHPQTPLCNVGKYPFTDIIRVDENLNSKLEALSSKLGVKHPAMQEKTSRHRTGSKNKLVDLFKGRPRLVKRILKLYSDDCKTIPEACDVKDLMAQIRK